MSEFCASRSLLDGFPVLLEPRLHTRVSLEISSFGQLDRPFLSLEGFGFLAGIEIRFGQRVGDGGVFALGQFITALGCLDSELDDLGRMLFLDCWINDGPGEVVIEVLVIAEDLLGQVLA